jgi:hypothetical protein
MFVGYLIGRFKFSARVLSGWNVVLGVAYIAALLFFSAVSITRIFQCSLKGQCHEMVVEISPWSSNLGLN